MTTPVPIPGAPALATDEPGAVAGGRRRVWQAFAAARFIIADVRAIWRGDPALHDRPLRVLEVPLYGSFWALLVYRIAHPLERLGVPLVPRLLSQVARLLTGIEIHPGAEIGKGLFIDHGMGVVIGQTAVVGRDVLLFHGVTLGGIDDRPGRRHAMVGDRVLVGAGAKLLGPISVGSDAKIGANAVVLSNVPGGATAVGIPARVIDTAPARAAKEDRCCVAA